MLVRAEQALARLYLRGKPVSLDMPPSEQALLVLSLARQLRQRPYVAHVVMAFARCVVYRHGAVLEVDEGEDRETGPIRGPRHVAEQCNACR